MGQERSLDLESVLVSRAVMYGLLQRVFSEVPDEDLAANEACEVVGQCFAVLEDACGLRDCRSCMAAPWLGASEDPERGGSEGSVGDAAGGDGIAVDATSIATDDVADSSCSGVDAAGDGAVRTPLTLEGEYNRLFVAVGKPAVCPWESMHLTGINALFQQNTIEVRRFYARHGLEARDAGRVADDHMAIELAFMREVALQAAKEEGSLRSELLHAQRQFLSEHLICWVDSFAEQVIQQDRSGYYCGYARLLADFIARDAVLLDKLLEG